MINLQVYSVDKSVKSAHRAYDRLIEAFPNCSQLRILKAEILFDHSLYDIAIETLRTLQQKTSADNLNIQYLIATIYYESEDFRNCRKILMDVVRQYYDRVIVDSEMLYAYRCLMLHKDMSDLQRQLYKQFLKDNPSRPTKLWLCYM
ncbi:hypothetical protein B4U80_12502 [Leptotrombidium deliense]|uniref:Uncharacterized protein n=1 Tax=Leptotrombidium deliense TaxID=299467 RepID=A0A443RT80_9ACAR|nr:hypothetical protein B4U80_12502 [Leptotrombidium deliense]